MRNGVSVFSQKMMLTDLAAESDDADDGDDGRQQLPCIPTCYLPGTEAGALCTFSFFVLSLLPEGSTVSSFVGEERKRHGLPTSLGRWTQNRILKQSDNEMGPGLTRILKIVKNDPSSPVTNCVDKFNLSRRWSHVLLMEKA